MTDQSAPARPVRPISPFLIALALMTIALASPAWCDGSADRRERGAVRRSGDPSQAAAKPLETLSPAARTLQEFRTNLQEYASIFDLDGMEDGLAVLVRPRSHLAGRAGYELLALEGAIASESNVAPESEDKGAVAMLARVRAILGDSDAGSLLAQALALRRNGSAASPEGAGFHESRRAEADRRLAALLFRRDGSWSADRLAETRRLFESLGDAEGLGSLLAAAASGSETPEESRELLDAAAEAFDRASDRWSSASARESCVLLGGPDRDDPRDLERLESAAQGYADVGDAVSEARARLAFALALLEAGRGRQALAEMRTSERLHETVDSPEESRSFCARGIADAVLQIVAEVTSSNDPATVGELLAEGEAAAKRGRSPHHEAWIAFERARLHALPAGPTVEDEAGATRALAIFRLIGNDEGIIDSAYLLGEWAASRGRHGEAAAYYREAALSSAALGESDAQRSLGVLRAEALSRGGQFDLAGRLARTLLDEGGLSPRRRQGALSVLGDALLVSGRPSEAESVYAQALRIAVSPGIAPRRAAALMRAGYPREAAALLQPIVATAEGTRLEDRLFEEALRLSGDPVVLPFVSETASGGLVDRARLAARLLTEGRHAESLQTAKELAETDEPAALFDAAALAAGAGAPQLAHRWVERALARGLDGFLLEIDPDLVSMRRLPARSQDHAPSPDVRH